MATEKLLVVNADDLGRTQGINAGIFAAHRRGLVTSATLMVGFPEASAAAAELSRYPELGVGLHVTLTGGAPTLPAERVPSLVDGNGRLPRRPEDLTAAEPEQVLAEVCSQLARFRELFGKLPTHLDSHHHSHRLPVVLDAMITVAQENDLPVRNAAAEVGTRLRAAGVPSTEVFVDRFYGAEARPEVLLEILETTRPGVVTELMCHPGHVDEELREGSTYALEREQELEILTDPRVLRAVQDHGIRLINFGTLKPGEGQ